MKSETGSLGEQAQSVSRVVAGGLAGRQANEHDDERDDRSLEAGLLREDGRYAGSRIDPRDKPEEAATELEDLAHHPSPPAPVTRQRREHDHD